jgi:hypothetical protein
MPSGDEASFGLGLEGARREGIMESSRSEDCFLFCDDAGSVVFCRVSGRPKAYPAAETPTTVAVAQSWRGKVSTKVWAGEEEDVVMIRAGLRACSHDASRSDKVMFEHGLQAGPVTTRGQSICLAASPKTGTYRGRPHLAHSGAPRPRGLEEGEREVMRALGVAVIAESS